MENFSVDGSGDYYYPKEDAKIQIIPLSEIEPPQRNKGIPPFKKYKLVPVLFGFLCPEPTLPPIEIEKLPEKSAYAYRVHNGYHRYYASIAVGYDKIPAIICKPFKF